MPVIHMNAPDRQWARLRRSMFIIRPVKSALAVDIWMRDSGMSANNAMNQTKILRDSILNMFTIVHMEKKHHVITERCFFFGPVGGDGSKTSLFGLTFGCHQFVCTVCFE